MVVAELAYRVYSEGNCSELGAQVYRILGVSFGFLASQSKSKHNFFMVVVLIFFSIIST